MPDKKEDPCDLLGDTPARRYCDSDGSGPPDEGGHPADGVEGSVTEGAVTSVTDLANYLIKKITGLIAPEKGWAPQEADSALYAPFMWLGQHLAVAIFTCVVVVCALTAWQGVPRLRQLGASTGWTLVAVAGMASVPGAVTLLNKAVSAAFRAAFSSDESTLFTTISEDMKDGADAGNPLAILIIIAALVVALAFAALVFMTRQLGIVAFVFLAPLVLASLARGGDMTAVKLWAQRLLGLMFAPFALLLISPLVKGFGGSLVMDAVLLIGADVIMLRMVFHGVPYFGPKVAGAARTLVERRTDNRLAHAVVRAGAPTVYERENSPRTPRTVDTPGRAARQDRGVLLAAYGVQQSERPGRLTTASAVAKAGREETDRADRTAQVAQARRQARAAATPQAPNPRAQSPAAPAASANPRAGQTSNPPGPAPNRSGTGNP
ncbi:hypothetical protein [Streptomyces sp. CB03238]|uniref:hypothetical protein n=1 Tax=Streptomyces sp. CB03238 TaxID=1907777 RepID=UPI000A1035FC|nr:hypothetical protein [Streptomyces sp. CB03238]ORT53480.1 hypothetical protein BKD26_38255 [Streptomyces sp. CB03238]